MARFNNVRDCFIEGSRALAGTKTWAAVTGEQTVRLHESGNDFGLAVKAFDVSPEVPSGAMKLAER